MKKNIQHIFLYLLLLGFVAVPKTVYGAKWYEAYEKAISNVEKGQYQTAIDNLQEAISLRSDSSSRAKKYGVMYIEYYPYYYLGLCYFNLQDYSEAAKWLQREEDYGQIQESDLYSELKRLLVQARTSAKKSDKPVITEPNITATSTQTITATSVTGDKQVTKPITQPSLTESKIAGYISNGKKFYNSKNYERALAEFENALAEDKTNREASEWRQRTMDAIAQNYIAQGERLESKKDYSGAAAAYQKASQLKPGDKNIAARIQRTKDKLGEEKAVADRRNRINSKLNIAYAYQRNGRLVEAKKAFEDVLKEDPSNEIAQNQINEIDKQLRAQKNSEEMKKQLEDYLRQGKQSAESGNLIAAKEAFDHAGAIDDSNPDLKDSLQALHARNKEKIKSGIEAYFKGDLSGAQEILKDCASIDEKSPGLYAFVGSIAYTRYLLSGEKEDNLKTTADAYFRKTFELDRTYFLSRKIFSPEVISYYSRIK